MGVGCRRASNCNGLCSNIPLLGQHEWFGMRFLSFTILDKGSGFVLHTYMDHKCGNNWNKKSCEVRLIFWVVSEKIYLPWKKRQFSRRGNWSQSRITYFIVHAKATRRNWKKFPDEGVKPMGRWPHLAHLASQNKSNLNRTIVLTGVKIGQYYQSHGTCFWQNLSVMSFCEWSEIGIAKCNEGYAKLSKFSAVPILWKDFHLKLL